MGCAAGANPVIERYFLDCVYNLRDYIGFCLGLTAILFWLVAQIPQFVKNYRTKTAEALSPWFLAQWLLGDTFNLLGCLLQGQQLPTTTYTAMYFVVADVFMMMQYIYYGALQRRREKLLVLQARRRHHRRHHHHSSGRGLTHAAHQQSHHIGGDDNARSSSWQQSQQDRRLTPASGEHDMEFGIDGSAKDHKQQCLRQQGCQAADGAELEQQWLEAGCSSSTFARHPPELTAASTALPTSCAAEAAAGFPRSGGQPRFGPGSTGSNRSVAAVGLLVTLGLVSLLLPANSTQGLFPSAPAVSGTANAAHPRNLEAGVPVVNSMHAISSSGSSGTTPGMSIAMFAGHMSAGLHGASSSNGVAASAGSEEPVEPTPRDWAFVIGTGLGYCSSVLYLCSRLSQIHKNYSRKSSEGLALAMFMMAVCANLCTGTGIIMRTFTLEELKEQLPWIIGSLGTITLDVIILSQSIKYGNKAHSAEPAATAAEQQSLLHAHERTYHVTHHISQESQYQRHVVPHPGHACGSGGGADGNVAATAAGFYHQHAVAGVSSGRNSSRTVGPGIGDVTDQHRSLTLLGSSAPVAPGWSLS